jgi:CRISPR system Cascade subunit CasA
VKIRYQTRTGLLETGDLFAIFAALSRDEVDDFPALRAHQRHPWHAFLCQSAALALLRADQTALPDDADGWRNLLTALAPEQSWSLVTDDWSEPALLQAPGLEASLRTGGKRAATPDGLDMLLTARNHDLKGSRMAQAGDDDWLFALVSLQTQEGQMGAGNYGISRMNGGYGARVAISLRPVEDRPGTAFRRDVARLLELRPQIEATSAAIGDVGLVWLLPWDGAGSLSFERLDPYYVEICRRVRLVREGGRITAVLANSKAPRIEAKAQKGVTGDPWAPVEKDGTKSWGISAQGFGYRQMVRLLDEAEVELPPLARPGPADGTVGLTLLASAVARGQGKTEGYHSRRIAIPRKALGFMVNSAGRDRIAHVAKGRREEAGSAARILRHALFILAQGGPDEARFDDEPTKARASRYERLYELSVDRAFFGDGFWAHVDDIAGQTAHLRHWREDLRGMATTALHAAETSLPRSDNRRLRAITRARSVFYGRMHRFVDPDAMPRKELADGR